MPFLTKKNIKYKNMQQTNIIKSAAFLQKQETKRAYRPKIIWTNKMLRTLQNNFSTVFNRELAQMIGVSMRSLIRKARELDLQKEEGFLDKNRTDICKLAKSAKKPNPMKGVKGWCVPGGESYRFAKGKPPPIVNYEKLHEKRNQTIAKEKMRIKYGLPQKTKLKLKNIY